MKREAAGETCASEKEFLEEISVHFYFRPEVFEDVLERKMGFFKRCLNKVVDIFGKERFSLEDQKYSIAIFGPKIVWHEMFAKFLLNLKRHSKLPFFFLQYLLFIIFLE